MNRDLDAVVIGGGIAGLAAALRLQQNAPRLNVGLLERDTRPGGWIRTERIGDFTIEAGPDSFLSTKPAGMDFCGEIGLESRLQGVDEETRATFIMRDGRLYPLPEGLTGLVPGRLGPLFRSPLLSYTGRMRVAAEQVVRVREGDVDESLGSFMRRRFGGEAYERLIEPLLSGIYGGNGDELSLLGTFPQLRKLEREHGSILRGVKRSSAGPLGPSRSPFVAPVDGMDALPAATARALAGTPVITGISAASIASRGSGYTVRLDNGETLHPRAVIVATPAYVTAQLVSTLDGTLSDLHAEIVYGSTATVSLGFAPRQVDQRDFGHGYIIPRREGRPIMAVTFSSRKFRHRAPAGALLVRGFVRSSGTEELSLGTDTDLIETVRSELRQTFGIKAEPQVTRVFRLPRSMPQYAVRHVDRVKAIQARLASLPGLFVAGAAYNGVGIPDCIASGQVAADGAALYLTRKRASAADQL